MSKKNKKIYKASTSSDIEYGRVIKIMLGVLVVLGLTYLVTALLTGEINLKKEEAEEVETSIQYEEIIAGQIFNRSNDEYYVLLFNFTDTFASYYLSLKDSYLENDDALPVYIVDLEKHINQAIVAESDDEISGNVNSIDNLKVTNPMLIKISNHRVTERIIGKDSILDFFEEDD